MKHLVIKDSQLNGWEYGMLRSFETAIVKETDATQVELPKYNLAPRYLQNFGHGMKLGIYRKYFPENHSETAWALAHLGDIYRIMGHFEKAESLLQKSEQMFRLLFLNSGEAILLTNLDGSIDAANPAACKIFGRSEKEICSVGRNGIIDLKDPKLILALEERKQTGKFIESSTRKSYWHISLLTHFWVKIKLL